MSEQEEKKQQVDAVPQWQNSFRVLLGGFILIWILYYKLHLEREVADWLLLIPGALLGLPVKDALVAVAKAAFHNK